MKQLTIILTALILLSSCWDKKTTAPRELDQAVFAEERVPIYDSVSQWSVEQKQYIKVWGIARYENVPLKEFEVIPNGEQVKKFANDQGQVGLNWIGILIAVGIAVGGFFGAGYYSSGAAKGIIRAAAILVAIAVGFFTLKPANIAQNNAKTITEKQLKHYQAIDPELNYFWDSVYKAGGIIGTKK